MNFRVLTKEDQKKKIEKSRLTLTLDIFCTATNILPDNNNVHEPGKSKCEELPVIKRFFRTLFWFTFHVLRKKWRFLKSPLFFFLFLELHLSAMALKFKSCPGFIITIFSHLVLEF